MSAGGTFSRGVDTGAEVKIECPAGRKILAREDRRTLLRPGRRSVHGAVAAQEGPEPVNSEGAGSSRGVSDQAHKVHRHRTTKALTGDNASPMGTQTVKRTSGDLTRHRQPGPVAATAALDSLPIPRDWPRTDPAAPDRCRVPTVEGDLSVVHVQRACDSRIGITLRSVNANSHSSYAALSRGVLLMSPFRCHSCSVASRVPVPLAIRPTHGVRSRAARRVPPRGTPPRLARPAG